MHQTTRRYTASSSLRPHRSTLLAITAACQAFAIWPTAQAGEIYKLRQSPIGAFGGEIAVPADNPGFFGTAILTDARIEHARDGSGNDISLPARTVALPTGTPSRGAVKDGTYSLSVPASPINFSQSVKAINLIGGYLSESTYRGGHLVFAVNVPLVHANRTFTLTTPTGVVTPTPPDALPAPLRAAVGAVAAAANKQIQAGVAQVEASQNQTVDGIGDTELSLAWLRHYDRLKVVVGASLYIPTGKYDKDRGPNPGFGTFYTFRPGIAATYALNPDHDGNGWDKGVTVAARVSYGINSINTETDYRSGNFIYTEVGVVKVMGNWAFGGNVLAIRQVTDDSGTGVPADGGRYRNNSAGPFLSYKLPGKNAGFNLHYSKNFSSSNALSGDFLQLRLIKAW